MRTFFLSHAIGGRNEDDDDKRRWKEEDKRWNRYKNVCCCLLPSSHVSPHLAVFRHCAPSLVPNMGLGEKAVKALSSGVSRTRETATRTATDTSRLLGGRPFHMQRDCGRWKGRKRRGEKSLMCWRLCRSISLVRLWLVTICPCF